MFMTVFPFLTSTKIIQQLIPVLNLNKFSEIMIFIKEGLVCVYKVLILLRFRKENVIRNQGLGIGSKY